MDNIDNKSKVKSQKSKVGIEAWRSVDRLLNFFTFAHFLFLSRVLVSEKDFFIIFSFLPYAKEKPDVKSRYERSRITYSQ
jgi:hypothetical protein